MTSLRHIASYYLSHIYRPTKRPTREADRPNGSPAMDTHPPCQNDFGGGAAVVGYGG